MLALRQSTHQHTDRPRRYRDAVDAANRFVEMRSSIEGAKGIDHAKPLVQTCPRPESPGTNNVDDLHELRLVFEAAAGRCAPERFRAWYGVRIDGESQRSTADALEVGKSTVGRWVDHVDHLVEQELSDRGLLVRSQARFDAEVYHHVEGDTDEELPSVRGPRQAVRVWHGTL